jgi:N-acetylneuraminic acid mutarotase
MFLFGGNNYNKTVVDYSVNNEVGYLPLYSLNMKTFSWNQVKTRGDIVKPRDEHTAVLDEANSSMVIFGGFEEGERTNDTIVYNLKTNIWSKIKLAENGKIPCARSGHSACIEGNLMYVFGGKTDNSVKLNDLWSFNLQSHLWNKISPVDDVMPETRSGHTAVIYENILVIFGGIYEVTKELNDVCAFSLSQKRWVPLCEAMGSPVKKKKSSMFLDTSVNLRE